MKSSTARATRAAVVINAGAREGACLALMSTLTKMNCFEIIQHTGNFACEMRCFALLASRCCQGDAHGNGSLAPCSAAAPCSRRWPPPSPSGPACRPGPRTIRCRPGTTARRSRRSSTSSRRPPPRAAPNFVDARRPHRHLRPGRHHLGRAAALRPGPVRARPAGGDGAGASRSGRTTEPFKAVLTGDHAAMAKFSEKDWMEIVAVTHAGMSTADFEALVADWLPKPANPVFKRPVTDLTYQPMLEVMDYLRANGFRTYIVTGGGQEFVRVYSEQVYGVPPEQVVGSSIVTKYETSRRQAGADARAQGLLHRRRRRQGRSASTSSSASGRRSPSATPTATARCWNGPPPATARGSACWCCTTTRTREFAYGPANGLPDSHIGTFSQALMDEAEQQRLDGDQHEGRLEPDLFRRHRQTEVRRPPSSGGARGCARLSGRSLPARGADRRG